MRGRSNGKEEEVCLCSGAEEEQQEKDENQSPAHNKEADKVEEEVSVGSVEVDEEVVRSCCHNGCSGGGITFCLCVFHQAFCFGILHSSLEESEGCCFPA